MLSIGKRTGPEPAELQILQKPGQATEQLADVVGIFPAVLSALQGRQMSVEACLTTRVNGVNRETTGFAMDLSRQPVAGGSPFTHENDFIVKVVNQA